MHDDDTDLPHELDIPDGVLDSDEALEVLRAWIADGSLHVIFDPETFNHDVTEWGRLLADIAHHVAHAVHMDGQMSEAEALARIHDSLDQYMGGNESVQVSGKNQRSHRTLSADSQRLIAGNQPTAAHASNIP